ncbi:MAG: RluA family pseudouridine synthase [Rickettsiales bacterium]|jgi:23S rRNA pseudouridine1911/1915/1917 synthase|nr:RluA family pseudouridine synthase [Rickettsiales bacterium]
MKKEFHITEPFKRLDAAAAYFMPEYSRSKIQAMEVSLNGKPAKWSLAARPGDTLSLVIPAKGDTNREAVCHSGNGNELEILFEDAHIIAAVKPRGIPTHPGAGGHDNTFVQMLLAHTALSAQGGAARPGIVHRLDKDTSGILVAAKTDEAFAALSEIFSRHDITRKYTAFVWGVPGWDKAEITGNIQRSKKNRQKMALVKIGGKPATTMAELKQVWPRAGISEISATLLTGRTHQIRVHLSTHGFPLVGDKTYGRALHRIQSINPSLPAKGDTNREAVCRSGECGLYEFLKDWTGGQMLHAGTLEFTHPITKKPVKLHSPLPEDMQLLKNLLDDYQ